MPRRRRRKRAAKKPRSGGSKGGSSGNEPVPGPSAPAEAVAEIVVEPICLVVGGEDDGSQDAGVAHDEHSDGGIPEAAGTSPESPGPIRLSMKDKFKWVTDEVLREENRLLKQTADEFQELLLAIGRCANSMLPDLSAKGEPSPAEDKKEKHKALRDFHQISVNITEAQERLRLIPEAMDEMYAGLNLEEALEMETDDEKFLALLDEFNDMTVEEVKTRGKDIGMKEVKKNADYQEFLVDLNRFVVRRNTAPAPSNADADVKVKVEQDPDSSGPSSRGLPSGDVNQSSGPSVDANGDSDEVEALNEYIPTNDPLTRKPLRYPWVNKKCKHVYEYESIVELIRAKGARRLRCPYSGCPEFVKMEDLHKDRELARKITEKIKGKK